MSEPSKIAQPPETLLTNDNGKDKLQVFLALYDTRHDMLGERCTINAEEHAKYCTTVKSFAPFLKPNRAAKIAQEEDRVMDTLAVLDSDTYDFEIANELLLSNENDKNEVPSSNPSPNRDSETTSILQNKIIKVRLLKHFDSYKEKLKDILLRFYNKNIGLHTDCIKLYFYDDNLDNDVFEQALYKAGLRHMYKFNSIAAYWDEASKDVDKSNIIHFNSTQSPIHLNGQNQVPNLFMPANFNMNIFFTPIFASNTIKENTLTITLSYINGDLSDFAEHTFTFNDLQKQGLNLSVANLCSFLSAVKLAFLNRQLDNDTINTIFDQIDSTRNLAQFGIFIVKNKGDISHFANFVYNLKRSLDYSQILLVEHLNKEKVDTLVQSKTPNPKNTNELITLSSDSTAHTLITYDRLCFMKALMQNAPVIFQRKRGAYYELFINRGNVPFTSNPLAMLENMYALMLNIHKSVIENTNSPQQVLITNTRINPAKHEVVAQIQEAIQITLKTTTTTESTILIKLQETWIKLLNLYGEFVPIEPINNELNTLVSKINGIVVEAKTFTTDEFFETIKCYLEYSEYAVIQSIFNVNILIGNQLYALANFFKMNGGKEDLKLETQLHETSKLIILLSKLVDKCINIKKRESAKRNRLESPNKQSMIEIFDNVGMPYRQKHAKIPLLLKPSDNIPQDPQKILTELFKTDLIQVDKLTEHIEHYLISINATDALKLVPYIQQRGFTREQIYKWNYQPSSRAARGASINYASASTNLKAGREAAALDKTMSNLQRINDLIKTSQPVPQLTKTINAISKTFNHINSIRKSLQKLGANRKKKADAPNPDEILNTTDVLTQLIDECKTRLLEARAKEIDGIKMIGNISTLKRLLKDELDKIDKDGRNNTYSNMINYVYDNMLLDSYKTVCYDIISFLKSYDKGIQRYFQYEHPKQYNNLKTISSFLIKIMEQAIESDINKSTNKRERGDGDEVVIKNEWEGNPKKAKQGGGGEGDELKDWVFDNAEMHVENLLEIGITSEQVTIESICQHIDTYVANNEEELVYDDIVNLEECVFAIANAYFFAYSDDVAPAETTVAANNDNIMNDANNDDKQLPPSSPAHSQGSQYVPGSPLSSQNPSPPASPYYTQNPSTSLPTSPQRGGRISYSFFEDKPKRNPRINKTIIGGLANHLTAKIQKLVLKKAHLNSKSSPSFFTDSPKRNPIKKNNILANHLSCKIQSQVLFKLQAEQI